ncbi:MAG: CarD family transcriptional regulator [Acidobacteriota bacterium]
MQLQIGQKVAYPGQGVCLVESVNSREIAGLSISVYLLRVLSDNSTICVPTANAENVGIRPLITQKQCRFLIDQLSEDFECVSDNWKTRSRAFMDKLQSGDIFATADVLKQLTFLSHEKRLSFREQTLLEKAKFLIVSEITNANHARDESKVMTDVVSRVESACTKHVGDIAAAALAGH